MLKTWIVLILSLIPYISFGQYIQIIDAHTSEAIDSVKVISPQSEIIAYSTSEGLLHQDVILSYQFVTLEKEDYSSKVFDKSMSKTDIVELIPLHINLDEFVISGNRRKTLYKEQVFNIEKIPQVDIRANSIQTTADILSTSSKVYVQKSQQAGGSPTIRGFATNRVLLIQDGIRLNNAIFRSGNVQNVLLIDPYTIDQVEILFGPGSTMYGSDAIGGVMYFKNKSPKFSQKDSTLITANSILKYSTSNKEKTIHLDVNFGRKRFASFTSLTASEFDNLRSGSSGDSTYLRYRYQDVIDTRDTIIQNEDERLQIHSGYSQINLTQKIKYLINQKSTLSYHIYYARISDNHRYDRLLEKEDNHGYKYAEWYYGPQSSVINNLTYKSHIDNIFLDNLSLSLYHQLYKESRNNRKFGDKRLKEEKETVNIIGTNIDLDKELNRNMSLNYGAEIVYNKVNSRAQFVNNQNNERTKTQSRYPNNSKWLSTGMYAQFNFETHPLLSYHAGMRLSYYDLKAQFNQEFINFPFLEIRNKNFALNGYLGLNMNVRNNWQIQVNLSTGNRAPNIDDVGKIFSSQAGKITIPNSELQPEYAYSLDLGNNIKLFKSLSIKFSIYAMILDNAIVRRDFQFDGRDSIFYENENLKVQAMQNIGYAFSYGTTSDINLKVNSFLSLQSQFNFMKGYEQSAEKKYEPLTHITPTSISNKIRFNLPKWELSFVHHYNSRMDFSEMPINERTDLFLYAKNSAGQNFSPSWNRFDFDLSYSFNRFIIIRLSIYNLKDKLYRTYSSGINASGRSFSFSVQSLLS